MMTAWPALQPFDYEAIRAWQTISWLHSSPTDFGFFTPAHSLNEDPLAFFAAPGACYSPAVDRCSPTFAAQPQSGESYAPGDSLGNLLKLAESVFESKLASRRSDSNRKPREIRQYCQFCKNNKEVRSLYTNHRTRNAAGEIICPILMTHECEICGATGKQAHTRSYCPKAKIVREKYPLEVSSLYYNMRCVSNHDA